ncbi:MAG: hypothetical protein WCF85_15150 [Rhodospirillaceae bacterium]
MNQTESKQTVDLSSIQTSLTEVNNIFSRQSEILIDCGTKSLDIYRALCGTWLKNRSDDFQSGLSAVQRLTEQNDIGAAIDIYHQWATESLQRLKNETSALPAMINELNAKVLSIGTATIEPMTRMAERPVASAQATPIRPTGAKAAA